MYTVEQETPTKCEILCSGGLWRTWLILVALESIPTSFFANRNKKTEAYSLLWHFDLYGC